MRIFKLLPFIFILGGCALLKDPTKQKEIIEVVEKAGGLFSHFVPGGAIVSDIVTAAVVAFFSKKGYNSVVNAPPGKMFGSTMSPKRYKEINGD